MHEFILKYLSTTYTPTDINEVRTLTHTKVYGEDLQEDVIDMFQVSDVVATACIEIWVCEEYPNFDTEKFWEDSKFNSNYFLPISRQVSARTVGVDLVSVQPLGAPSNLMYSDLVDYTQRAMTQQVGIPAERFTQAAETLSGTGVTVEEAADRMRRLNLLWGGVTIKNPSSTLHFIQPTQP